MNQNVDHYISLTNINKMVIETRSEKIRFGVVGVINTLIDFGFLFTLKYFGFPIIAANTISTTIAFVASFTLNKKVVFKVRNSNLKREIALFIIVTLFGLWVLQPTVFIIIGGVIPPDYSSSYLALLVSKICATCVTIVWNYVTYSRIVFRTSNKL